MDLIAILQIAFRRWRILLPLLLLFTGVGAVAVLRVPLTYEVHGALRVTYPFARTLENANNLQRNPYYDTEGTAAVLALIALSPDVEKAVKAAGGTAKFATNHEGRSVITITTSDKDKNNALRTYRAVIRELGQRLDRLQEQKRIPRQYWVAVDDIVQPKEAETSATGRLKVVLAVGALGVLLSVGVCLIADYRMRLRAQQQASSVPDPAVYPADDEPDRPAGSPQASPEAGPAGGPAVEDERDRLASSAPEPDPDQTDPYLSARLGTTTFPIRGANGAQVAADPAPRQ